MAVESGRDISTLSVSVFGAPPNQETIESYKKAGINRALFALPSEGRDNTFKLLDSFQHLIG
jgi:hypothetical protein